MTDVNTTAPERASNPSWYYDPKELVDRPELARRLGRSPKSIANWVSTQNLPYVRVKHKYMFLLPKVHEWAKHKTFIKDWQLERLKADYVFDGD